MLNLQTIAAAHHVSPADLATALAARGWDFGPLDISNPTHIEFAQRVCTHIATEVAKRAAQKAAQHARFAAKWETPTKAAQANPGRSCRRCGGVGRIITFSHVNDGLCCRCDGRGVV